MKKEIKISATNEYRKNITLPENVKQRRKILILIYVYFQLILFYISLKSELRVCCRRCSFFYYRVCRKFARSATVKSKNGWTPMLIRFSKVIIMHY